MARIAARRLLLAWAVAALLAWLLPWPSTSGGWGVAPSTGAWLAMAAPACTGFLLLLGGLAWWRGWGASAVAAVVVAGLLHTLGSAAVLLQQAPVFDQRVDCRIEGRVVGLIDEQPNRRRFRLLVAKAAPLVADDAVARRVCGGLPVGARLRLSDYNWGGPVAQLSGGRHYEVVARLKPLHGHANPGGFDYRRWLFRHQIVATGYLRESPVDRGVAAGWQASVDRLRELARERLQASVRHAGQGGEISSGSSHLAAAAALWHGLALGDKGELSDSQWETLLASGTNHLLAISGLHVGMIAALAALLTRALWGRLPLSRGLPAQRIAAIVAVVAGWSYALIAGLSIPTLRAALMLTVLLLGVLMQRRWRLTDLWLLAFVLVLWLDPFAPLDMGFWLSFAAVLLIILFIRGRDPLWRPFELLRLQWLLTLGLLPLTWGLFDRIAFASLPANLLAVPLVSMLITPLALIGLFVSWFSTAAGAGIAWLIGWLGTGLFVTLEWLVAVMPDSTRAPPSAPALGLFALGVAWLMLPSRFPGRYLALMLMLPAIMIAPARPVAGTFEAEVLDVGQGSAVWLQTAHHDLLYDAGPRVGQFDTGEAIVLPALRAVGVKDLDRIVISHQDLDHIGGLAAIRSTFPEASVLGVTGPGHGLTADEGEACQHGVSWIWDGVRFELLQAPLGSANNRSCVLRVVGRRWSLLLTGDLEAAGEHWLLRNADMQADVVVVGHHGSSTSSTQAFVEASGARQALVSVGFLNRWGHPRPEVVSRWQAAGARVWRTDRDGSLRVIDGVVRATRDTRWSFVWRRPMVE
ncbi:MAG: DNA internalization-related competence protein ComEC/Rec2 [Halothiobacillaceae bacterium]